MISRAFVFELKRDLVSRPQGYRAVHCKRSPMAAYQRQKEKFSHYLSFDFCMSSGHWVKARYLRNLHLHFHLGFVHPLQDVALHQCLPLSSVCCFPNPGGSLLLCYVILPSSAWSSSRPLPSPSLPLCASPCPPIVL